MTAADDFAAAICAALGSAPDVAKLEPGRFIRFSTNGKRGDDSGWARLFEDERGGVFGDWRTGFNSAWQATEADKPRTSAERKSFRQRVRVAAEERAIAELGRHEAAAIRASAIWSGAVPIARHAYAERKGFELRGMRMQRAHQGGCSGAFYVTNADGEIERLKGDLLLVPMHGADQRLWSLQAIDADGRKSFLKSGRTKGLFFVVGRQLLLGIDERAFAGDVAIAEGIATASSVLALSGSPVFAAFHAGNLLHVARAVRQRLPRARITIAGDVDPSGIGQRKADEAAAAVGGFVSSPPFSPYEVAAGATDWNDYVRLHPARDTRAEGMQA